MPARGAIIDISGQRFGRLVAVAFSHRDDRRRSHWKFRCDCGTEVVSDSNNVKRGAAASCGCLKAENNRRTWTKHGHAAGNTPEYESWSAMLARVRATTGRKFSDYGGRGITVCERWLSFESFLADMGPRPQGTSLDRIDNNGNYEPGNCRWATAPQQVKNRRPSSREKGTDAP